MGFVCVHVFVSVWVMGNESQSSRAVGPWWLCVCVCVRVCPAGGSGPGLHCLPRWGMAGAEWEGRVGGKSGLGL